MRAKTRHARRLRGQKWLSALVGMLACFARLNGATLFDNGLPANVAGYEMTGITWMNGYPIGGGILADDFTTTVPARLESVKLWSFEANGGFQGTVLWQICSTSGDDLPGAIIASGTSFPTTHLPTGSNLYGYPEFSITLDIGPVVLPAGSYWLTLHNGPLVYNFNAKVYWEATNENTTRRSYGLSPPFDGEWYPNDGDIPNHPEPRQLAFQLNGTPGARVTALNSNSGVPRVSFTTVVGQQYRIEYKEQLATPSSWTVLPGASNIPGTGTVRQIDDQSQNSGRRFYRVILL